MDVEALLNTVRGDFLDDEESPYRWGSSKLLRWLNRAQEEACFRQRLLVDESTPAITEITLIADTASYSLDPRIVLVDRVVYDGRTIQKATKHQLDRLMPAWREMEPGEPRFYLQNDLTIRLLPVPSQAEDGQILTIRASRLPLESLVDNTDVPEIPVSHHENLCYYVAARAFMLPDEDTQNTGLSREYMSTFDKAFGPQMSADVLAHRRRETGTTWIGNPHAYHGRQSTTIRRNAWDYED